MNTPTSPDIIEFMQWSQSRMTRALVETLKRRQAVSRNTFEIGSFDPTISNETLRAHGATARTITQILQLIDNLPQSMHEE